MKVQKKGNDYSGRAVEKKTPVKTVLRAIIIFAVCSRISDLYLYLTLIQPESQVITLSR